MISKRRLYAGTEEVPEKDWDMPGEIKEKGTDLPTPPEGNATPEKKPSRAAELAAQYHANLYGANEKAKGE